MGRSRKPYEHIGYSIAELKLMLLALKKMSDTDDLIDKIKYDIKERKRLELAYIKAKDRLFGILDKVTKTHKKK